MLTSLKNSLSNYFGGNKPPRPPPSTSASSSAQHNNNNSSFNKKRSLSSLSSASAPAATTAAGENKGVGGRLRPSAAASSSRTINGGGGGSGADSPIIGYVNGGTRACLNGGKLKLDTSGIAINGQQEITILHHLIETDSSSQCNNSTASSVYAGSSVSSNQHRHSHHQHRHNSNHHKSPRQQQQQLVDVRTIEVRLMRDGSNSNSSDSYGFTLRPTSTTSSLTTHPPADNTSSSSSKSLSHRSFIVTFIRPSSSAERNGTIQVGDRLVTINGREVAGSSLVQVQKWIRESDKVLLLTIEYDVAIVDRGQFALHSPLLVEVEKSPCALLGIHLGTEGQKNRIGPSTGIFIESIEPASIAERCGALQSGDQILAVGDVRLDVSSELSVEDVNRLLNSFSGSEVVKLIIAPVGQQQYNKRSSEHGSRRLLLPPPSPRLNSSTIISSNLNGSGTLRSNRTTASSCRTSKSTRSERAAAAAAAVHHRMADMSGSSSSVALRLETASVASSGGSNGSLPLSRLSHPERVSVTLQIDCRGSYGLALGRITGHEAPVVLNVEANSPCDKSGCIQPGDRILRINQQSTQGLNLDQVIELMRESKPRMTLDVEFDVADAVVPASGVYWLKLVKPGGSSSNFGITLQDTNMIRESDGRIIVSGVSPGSVAHRSGSIQSGDRLMAINNTRIDSMTVDQALLALNGTDVQVIRLKLYKGELKEEPEEQPPVVYTVELIRHGGPLGVTISGTESPDDPITISGITEGGLAERTGALHIGDRLLAINGRTLQGKLLSEAIEILQTSGDIVTLKIGKSDTTKLPNNGELQREDYLPLKLPPLPSIDSAVESWISGASNSRASNNNNVNNNNSNDSTPIYTAESATVRRRQNNSNSREWEMLSSPSVDSGQFEVQCNVIVNGPVPSPDSPTNNNPSVETASSNQLENATSNPSNDAAVGGGVIRMSDLALVQRCSTLPRNYRKIIHPAPQTNNTCNPRASPIYCLAPAFSGSQLPPNVEIHQITLQKDKVYEDFGFSVSDGLYERGIYVNRIRKGGPADIGGLLHAFDRILQVNDTRTYDFDCCLTVPLIAAAGDVITLVIGRNPLSVYIALDTKESHGFNWDEEDEGVIPADADDCASSSGFVGIRTVTTTL